MLLLHINKVKKTKLTRYKLLFSSICTLFIACSNSPAKNQIKISSNSFEDCTKKLSKNFNASSGVYIEQESRKENIIKNNTISKKQSDAKIIRHSETVLAIPPSKQEQEQEQEQEQDSTKVQETEIHPCAPNYKKRSRAVNSLDIARKNLGKRYLNLTRAMDNTFSGNRTTIHEENHSFLRLETQTSYFKRGGLEQDVSLRAKLDLPKTEHKFQVYFDSRLNDEQSIEERNATVSSGDNSDRRAASAGIEYGKKKGNSPWFTGVRLGAETRVPLRTFARFKFGRQWEHSETFSTKFQQDIWHLDGVGWGETTYLDFKTQLNKSIYVLLENEFEYEDEPFPISYYHAVSLRQRLNNRSRIRYRIAAVGSDDEERYIDRYITDFTYTYRLHEDWLFISLIPEIEFRGQYQTDKEFDENPLPVPPDWQPWKPEASFTLKFDIFSN